MVVNGGLAAMNVPAILLMRPPRAFYTFMANFPEASIGACLLFSLVPAGDLHFIFLSPACRASDWQTTKSME